ncbi:hypothetical protein MYXE_41990 [Mycobacterium xenopi]|uniref:Uncharacterized protein n=1 Tax=Mycobacterium xenopi TaxID=1789 RepID=A0AAD1H3B0_MYCXE|nr:hypothetical protein I552_6985 [Mycobacterium xenopi 3993]BBU24409.1 hypothetical protein MYXE_41990 [Mycobacterium xenopi]
MIMPGRIPLPAKARRIGYDTVTSGQLDVVGFPAVSALPRPTRKGPQMTPRVLRLLYEVLSRVGCNPSLSAADVPDSWLVERIEGEHPLPPGRALDLAELDVGHDFSLIVDSGCYYGLAERQRDAYAAGVTRVASPGRYCSRLVSPGFRASSPASRSRICVAGSPDGNCRAAPWSRSRRSRVTPASRFCFGQQCAAATSRSSVSSFVWSERRRR